MKTIELTQNQVAIVDDCDYEVLKQWKWFASWQKNSQCFYAGRWSPMVKGVRGKQILMHRQIMGLLPGDPRQVDHIEPTQTLDNRRSNLRIASRSQNKQNAHRRRDNTSGYKGTWFIPSLGKWRSVLTANGVRHELGVHATAEKAFSAYCDAAKKYHKQFARTS